MKMFRKSLTFRIGTIIILIEIIVLALIGFFYVSRFSAEVDQRIRARAAIPGALIAKDLLNLSSVADREAMTDLVGEGLAESMVVRTDKRVMHSLNPDFVWQKVSELPDVEADWFDKGLNDTTIIETAGGLVSITPIRSFANDSSPFFVYIKMEAGVALDEKRSIIWLFVLGSLTAVLVTSIALIYLLNSTIVTRVRDVLNVLGQVEAGDLITRIKGPIMPDEIGTLQNSVNSMVARLKHTVDGLEERVTERTRSLETIIAVSHRIASIIDLGELLRTVVDDIKTEFEFYHVHIYLIDGETGDLVMKEGSGEVGQHLKAAQHTLPAGQGIVGTVASTKEYFLSNNVDEVLNFIQNPLLPDTKSELAVPLRKGGQVLGVLDIQSEAPDRFDSEDVSLIQSLANQIAAAIDNARLLEESQTALKEVERLNRRLTREGWDEFSTEIVVSGYRYTRGTGSAIEPLQDVWSPPMSQAAMERQVVNLSSPGNGQAPNVELAVPLVLRGEVVGALGIKRDESPDWAEEELSAVEAVADQITRALENARLSKEQEKTIVQLREIDRLKSEFLTSMSHELRTPLNSIIGFADVMLQGIDGELNEMARNDVQLIYNSGQHLLALINDILDISKIEAGMMELVRDSLNVSNSINDVRVASTSLIKDKPVEILVETDDDLPPIYADKLRLNQILLNLVSNAVKFTAEGNVTIKAELREQFPDHLYISVSDTGIGIPPEKIGTIFDRFLQADSSTTREFGGTGLGLAITKQLVEMHGGIIGIESEVGAGSTFYFTIPLAIVAEGVVDKAEA